MSSLDKILKPFEHTPSTNKDFLFGEQILPIAEEIRKLYKTLTYDHRPFLPKEATPEKYPWAWTEEFRIGQACFKYAVAKILRPETIIEIGVGAGISALAFHSAWPGFRYCGLDLDTHESFYNLETTTLQLTSIFSRKPTILEGDSTKYKKLPDPFEMVFSLGHLDGGHDFETAKSDMKLLWDAGTRWILVDDANDAAVTAGVFSAIHELPHGKTDYAYFEDTWSGNLLFRRT